MYCFLSMLCFVLEAIIAMIRDKLLAIHSELTHEVLGGTILILGVKNG